MATMISIASDKDKTEFGLKTPVTFTGKADSTIVKVELYAEQFFLGSTDVESESWMITYPGFNKSGKRNIKAIGFDSNGNQSASTSINILITNPGLSGYEPGIDVSDYDGFVNWPVVRNTGYSFAFTKATEGQSFRAVTFPENWRRMQGVGIIRGAYHFFRPLVNPEAQARNFLDYINSVDPIQPDDLPPALDLEHYPERVGQEWASISLAERVSRVKDWISIVEDETKRKPVIYTSSGFWSSYMLGVRDFSSYPLWVAHYTQKPMPSIPKEWSTWTFWQYSDTTEVPGIPQPHEDGNRFNGELGQLIALIDSTKVA